MATKTISRKTVRSIQNEALRALHERGHFTSLERHYMEVDHCQCGGFLSRGNVICDDCARKLARRKSK